MARVRGRRAQVAEVAAPGGRAPGAADAEVEVAAALDVDRDDGVEDRGARVQRARGPRVDGDDDADLARGAR